MKNYFILIFLFIAAHSFGQSTIDNVQSSLATVSLNINSANDTYNLEDLKFYAGRASESIKKVILSLETSRCSKALNLSKEISGIIDEALIVTNHSDGRSTIFKSRSLIAEAFYEYDVCGFKRSGKGTLNKLEKQQSTLRLQQIELDLKSQQIKKQLEEQKEKEVFLEKKKIIDDNTLVDISSLKTFNERLEACNCGAVISDVETENLNKLTTKSIAEIKSHYLKRSIALTKRFLEKLKNCKD